MTGETGPIRVAVLTISDSAYLGTREDNSGPAVRAEMDRLAYLTVYSEILPDEPDKISKKLAEIADGLQPDILFTAGGTGLGPRDNTPEATTAVIEKEAPGLAELMRSEGRRSTPLAALSRAKAGVRGRTLIINLPGSVKGVQESIRTIAELLPHAVELMRGGIVRCGG